MEKLGSGLYQNSCLPGGDLKIPASNWEAGRFLLFDLRKMSAVSIECPDTNAATSSIEVHPHTHARAHIVKWPRKIKLVPFVRPLHEEASPRDGSPGRDQRRFVGHLGHLHRHHSFQLPPPPPPQQQQLTYNLCSTSFNSFSQVTGRSRTNSLTHSLYFKVELQSCLNLRWPQLFPNEEKPHDGEDKSPNIHGMPFFFRN